MARRRWCRCGCKTDISHRRSDCVWATEGCRKRFKRRASADKSRTRGARAPTRYIVFRIDRPGRLRSLGSTLAHDRQSAIREVAGDRRSGEFVAIPERMLRIYDRTGRAA
jgi:hypothetical protein